MSTPTADRIADHRRPSRVPFGSNSVAWLKVGHVTEIFAAPTSFILQTMEPSFSAVSEAHGMSAADPVGRSIRALASMMVWIYGGQEAIAEADRLREAHKDLNVVDRGVRYTALASYSWAWVLHTVVYGIVTRDRYFARTPMSAVDKERLYQDATILMRNFLVPPKEIPPTYAEWERWFADQVTDVLQSTKTAADYLRVIGELPAPAMLPAWSRPLWAVAMRPCGRVLRFVAIGMLPEAAREKLELQWTSSDERRLRLFGRVVGHVVAVLPERLRYLPIAFEARRLERDRRRLRSVMESRPR